MALGQYDYSELVNKQLNDMKKKTGYDNMVQIQGQRKTRPTPYWTGPPPPRGCEIFIGKIPSDCFEDVLIPLFQNAGVIYEFRLLMEFNGENRRYAFATYTNKEDARKAIILFDDYEIRPGHRIGVKKSTDNSTLEIKGLPWDKSEADIYEEFSKFTPGIIDVTLCTALFNNYKNDAYLEYESHYTASIARKILILDEVKPFELEMQIEWPDKKLQDKDADSKMERVRALFVRNLPLNVSESTLRSLFSCQGNLTVVQVKKVRDNKHLTSVAFVHFRTHQEALNSLNMLHGFNLNGYFIEVFWARPTGIIKEKLKEKYLVKSLSDLDSSPRRIFNSYTEKKMYGYSPVAMLYQICQKNGWGEPVICISHTCSTVDKPETFYKAKVIIPNLPCSNKSFDFFACSLSLEEAENCVAEYALRNIISLLNCPAQVTYASSSFPQPYKQLPYFMTDPVPEIDLSSNCVWNSLSLKQASETYEYLNQDPFMALDLMASAASLASIELQSKAKPNNFFRIE